MTLQLSGVQLASWTGDSIGEISGISISSPADGQYLRYNGTTTNWQNSLINYEVFNSLVGLGGTVIAWNATTGKVEITSSGGGSGAVSSVTGTANQITASPTVGAVVISLPTSMTAPGTFTTIGNLTSNAGLIVIGQSRTSSLIVQPSTANTAASAIIVPSGTGSNSQIELRGPSNSFGMVLLGVTGNGYIETDTLRVTNGAGTVTNATIDSTGYSGRYKPRVVTVSSNAATYSINTDLTDIYRVTGQTVAITNISTTGTPNNSDGIIIQITGTTSVPLTWNSANFESSTELLPTTTAGTAMIAVGLIYNPATSKWRCMGVC